jgi:hypothetical protein
MGHCYFGFSVGGARYLFFDKQKNYSDVMD